MLGSKTAVMRCHVSAHTRYQLLQVRAQEENEENIRLNACEVSLIFFFLLIF